MKALKIIARIFFTILFIVLIFCIVIICTYTLGQPDRSYDSVSRSIITGPWTEIGEEGEWEFVFDQAGEFVIKQDGKTLADGYFKIDEDSSKVKLFMLPGHYTDDFSRYVKLKFFAEVSFSNLNFPEPLDKDTEIDPENPPTVTLLMRKNDGTNETTTVSCECKESTIDLYNSEHDLTKDA